jgi:hypothetical protein
MTATIALPTRARPRRGRRSPIGVAVVLGLAIAPWAIPVPAHAATTDIDLGTAEDFAVLAGSGITNTGPTTITGNFGTYPTATETGTGSITVTGTDHAGDAVTQQAKDDLVTAYVEAAGNGPTTQVATDLAGQTLAPGVYVSANGTFGNTGVLTLDGQGQTNPVFVFQASSTLITGSSSSMVLINGADACNVYWQVGSSATLGTASALVGTVLALTSITLTTGATVEGRVLARNGAVTMDTNTITLASCTAGTTTDTTTPGDTSRSTTPGDLTDLTDLTDTVGTPGSVTPGLPISPRAPAAPITPGTPTYTG